MAVNKNFAIKNGLEVNTKLILADANTNKVGIGSTGPRFELDVAGGIGATDLYVSGLSTVSYEFNVGTDGSVLTVLGVGGSVGVGTALPEYLLDVRSPVSTGQTALYVQGDVKITGDLDVDDITFDQANINILDVTEFATISQLDVAGFTTTQNLNVNGTSIFSDYVNFSDNVDISGTLNVGGATTLSGHVDIPTSLNITGVTTANNLNVNGHGEFDNINVSGVATITQLDVQNDFDVYASTSNFYNDVIISGDLTVNGTQTVINTQSLFVGDKDIILGIGTTPGDETDVSANGGGIAVASTEGSPLVCLQCTGINTFPGTYKQIIWNAAETFGVGTTDAWLFNYAVGIGSTLVPDGVRFAVRGIQFTDDTINTPNINVSNTSTLGDVQISAGIITASSGIVTYYGDGSQLSGVIGGIGIGTTGGTVGYGITFLNFFGAGVSTAFYEQNVGIATIFFEGGGGGSISISTVAPSSPGSGDLWYSPDYGRTFIYYDETVVGYGTDSYWVDASPFNSGIITTFYSGVAFTSGFAGSPSWYFNGDPTTGVFSPINGQLTFVSTGSSVLNVNSDGLNVNGIVTATSFVGDGSGLTGAGSTVFNDTTTDQEFFPLFTDITTGSITSSGISTSKLTYNPSSGTLTVVDLNSTSDINLKKNVETIDNAIQIIDNLRGVSFDWKETGKSSYGVIAQELEKVLPDLVKDGDIKSVNYNGIIGILIEAVKELKQEIEFLKSSK